MLRVLLGIIKGGLVGAAAGFAASKIGLGGGMAWLIYGAVGFVVGIVCGKAIWRQETVWTPVLKGLFGLGICVGLYFLGRKFLGGFQLPFAGALGVDASQPLIDTPLLLAPALGIVYGVFVEIDDGDSKGKDAAPAAPARKS